MNNHRQYQNVGDIPINGEAGINPIKRNIARLTLLEEALCIQGTNRLNTDPEVIIQYVRSLAEGKNHIPSEYKKFIDESELCQRLYAICQEVRKPN